MSESQKVFVFRHLTIRDFTIGPFDFKNHEMRIKDDRPMRINGEDVILTPEDQAEMFVKLVRQLPLAQSNPILEMPAESAQPMPASGTRVARSGAGTNEIADLTATAKSGTDASAKDVTQELAKGKQVLDAPKTVTPTASAAAAAMAAAAKK